MLSKSQEGYTNDMKGLSSSGLNVLTMKSRNNQKKDTKKSQTTISSSKRKSNVLGNTTHTENNVYESAQFKTMKNSLNNLFRTYSTTKDENRTQKKSIDPHKKKSSSPAINNVYSDEKYNKSSSQSNNMSSKLRATRSLAGINSQIVGHPSPNKHYHTIGNTMSPHVGSNSGGSNVGNVKSASVKNKRSASSNSHSQKPASQRGNSNTNIKTSNVVKQNSWTNFSKNWSKKLTQSSSLQNKKQDIEIGKIQSHPRDNSQKQQLIYSCSNSKPKTGYSSNSTNTHNYVPRSDYKNQLSKLLQTGASDKNQFFKSLEDRKTSKNSLTQKSTDKSRPKSSLSKIRQASQNSQGANVRKTSGEKNNSLVNQQTSSKQMKPTKYQGYNSSINQTSNTSSNINSYITQIKQDNLGTNSSLGSIMFNGPLNSRNNGPLNSRNYNLNKPTSSTSNKNRKKKTVDTKKATNNDNLKLKFTNVYYMSKLEFAYKTYSNDHYPTVFRQHFKQTLQSISILSKLAIPTQESISDKIIMDLPDISHKTNKKTIIFDLDETLIHCNENQNDNYDIKVPVTFPTGEYIEAGINVRPFAKDILQELVKQGFEVMVFTASHSCYANPVIDYLDPENKLITKRLFRDNCVQIAEGFYVKDLRIFSMQREMQNVLLVDNAAYSYALQLENGVPIIPFYKRSDDTELMEQLDFIMPLKDVDDVRETIRETFKYDQVVKYGASNQTTLFKEIFDM